MNQEEKQISIDEIEATLERLAHKEGGATELAQSRLVESYNQFERDFRNRYALLWWFTLLSPLVLTAVGLVLIAIVGGVEMARKFVIAAILTFFAFGRFIILGGSDGSEVQGWLSHINLEPWQLCCMVTTMDFITALFVTFHLGFLFKAPWIGPRVSALVLDSKFLMERHPWIKRVAFLGLVLFVIFPSSTTGSIGGSIFGRLLGLGRFRTVAGVLVGSMTGNLLMLLFANWINQHIGPDNVWIKLVGVLIIMLIFAVLGWRYQQVKKRYFAEESERQPDGVKSNVTG